MPVVIRSSAPVNRDVVHFNRQRDEIPPSPPLPKGGGGGIWSNAEVIEPLAKVSYLLFSVIPAKAGIQ